MAEAKQKDLGVQVQTTGKGITYYDKAQEVNPLKINNPPYGIMIGNILKDDSHFQNIG
ncbi:hypothetical protein [Pollutibacter soli]|uniref:hypothetical protein n=1 Tax=Pollutibacter soli TaxID=3034157 RepID=UPI00301321CC